MTMTVRVPRALQKKITSVTMFSILLLALALCMLWCSPENLLCIFILHQVIHFLHRYLYVYLLHLHGCGLKVLILMIALSHKLFFHNLFVFLASAFVWQGSLYSGSVWVAASRIHQAHPVSNRPRPATDLGSVLSDCNCISSFLVLVLADNMYQYMYFEFLPLPTNVGCTLSLHRMICMYINATCCVYHSMEAVIFHKQIWNE